LYVALSFSSLGLCFLLLFFSLEGHLVSDIPLNHLLV
jgi:hypothetical protein